MKKLLYALKGEIFSREILPDFLAAFKALVKTNMSADVLRSLSLFITYSLHKHNPTRPLRVKKSNIQMRRPGPLNSGVGPKTGYLGLTGELNEDGAFTRQQIGVMVLEMYHDLLCEDGHSTANLKKFAKTVTNKVGPHCYFILECMQHIGCMTVLLTAFDSGCCTSWQRVTRRWCY